MVLEILINIYKDLFKNYLNTSTKYILIRQSFFWTNPYEPGSIYSANDDPVCGVYCDLW